MRIDTSAKNVRNSVHNSNLYLSEKAASNRSQMLASPASSDSHQVEFGAALPQPLLIGANELAMDRYISHRKPRMPSLAVQAQNSQKSSRLPSVARNGFPKDFFLN